MSLAHAFQHAQEYPEQGTREEESDLKGTKHLTTEADVMSLPKVIYVYEMAVDCDSHAHAAFQKRKEDSATKQAASSPRNDQESIDPVQARISGRSTNILE